MKHEAWLAVGRRQLGLWPSQPWEPATMSAAYDLFRNIAEAPVQQAIMELSAEGREFAPAPGVVLSRALQIVIASTPLLQDPDLTRPLSPDEADRARRMAAALTGEKAQFVVATWMEFAGHAKFCPTCDPVARICRRPGLQSNVFPPMLYEVCDIGRPLFEAWRYAVDELRVAPERGVQQVAAL